ncbi:MAG: penicillin-binding protein activator LpoB [Odoribacteraceae bacterium]|jgi:uncharacterized protein (TIGR02722 family)|nr:penicillin-binding protein activator LpoB [Odoribacteraceae bacterium]
MKHVKQLLAGMTLLATLAGGCARTVTRVDPGTVIDLSGRWNDTDSRIVANDMTGDMFSGKWIGEFTRATPGRRPVIVVGLVENRSHEHINAATFIGDIEKAIVQDGNIRLVVAGAKRDELRRERAGQQDFAAPGTIKKWGRELGADFILQGTISGSVDARGRRRVVFYQVDLQLTDIETNEVVWIGDKKIKKSINN